MPARDPEAYREERNLRHRHRRRNDVARTIKEDTQRSDRKFKRPHDLDLDFIRREISNPCSYCGDDNLRKTLDRIDNALGHTRDNVRVACERCNYIRRNMPIDAWLIVAVGIRAAREQGLFGEWTGAIHRRIKLKPPTYKNQRKPMKEPEGADPVGVAPDPEGHVVFETTSRTALLNGSSGRVATRATDSN